MQDLPRCIEDFRALLEAFQHAAQFKQGNLIVLGASSSEVAGKDIGSATNEDIPAALLGEALRWAAQNGLFLAVQGCEHINRSLVVEAPCAERYALEAVNVVPHLRAGGGFATVAMGLFKEPVVVESLKSAAHGGVDIGGTFIGMHLRRVVVPLRLGIRQIGRAQVACARTRLPLVGGERARHFSG